MDRSRLEPLGVPEVSYEDAAEARRNPNALDRWLIRQIVSRLGNSPVRVALWNEPDITPRDGGAVVRILDRPALWQLVVNPNLHFGDLYSAGRLEVRGDLLVVLKEAYRYTSNNTTIGSLLARGRRLAPDLSESKRNIHHHYDIGNEFYTLWLDRQAHGIHLRLLPDPAE